MHVNPFDPIELHCDGWVSYDGNIDDTTPIIGHETIESITDPSGNHPFLISTAITVDHGTKWTRKGDSHEIADAEAQSYLYRVDGVLAQSYWSAVDTTIRGGQGWSTSSRTTPCIASMSIPSWAAPTARP